MHKNFMQKRTHSRTTAFQLLLPLVVHILQWVGQMTLYTKCILPTIETF